MAVIVNRTPGLVWLLRFLLREPTLTPTGPTCAGLVPPATSPISSASLDAGRRRARYFLARLALAMASAGALNAPRPGAKTTTPSSRRCAIARADVDRPTPSDSARAASVGSLRSGGILPLRIWVRSASASCCHNGVAESWSSLMPRSSTG